jgi:uncharacterized protein YndB with AHSA1/START domain
VTTTQTQDRIERQIDIDAPAEKVWALISRPGWWINDGTVVDVAPERRGDLDVVTHPEHGEFAIRTITLDPPDYAAFRWVPTASGKATVADQSTLTEFWIEGRDGGVVLKVIESGFASLDVSEAERRAMIAGNTEGWSVELEAARKHVETS